MTIFKTFLKVLNKNKLIIIIYTIILLFFTIFIMKTSNKNIIVSANKPNIFIINNDENIGLTKNLIEYMKKNCVIVELENNEDVIDNAIFYRDIGYVIYIPQNYRKDFLDGKKPEILVKSAGDYQGTFASILFEKYIKIANEYRETIDKEEDLIKTINEVIAKEIEIETNSKLDTENLQITSYYYSFLNYSLLAGCVFVICFILSSFQNENILKRTVISGMNYKKYNFQLLVANTLFAIVLWLFYVILSFILIGKIMFTIHGLIYILNSFIFTLCSVCIAFLVANLISNKNAINGVVNVIAIGSSCLCGVFVPIEWISDFIIKCVHILPSYYYINTNKMLIKLENVNFYTLKPIIINMGIIILFSITFIILTNIISKRKRINNL